jgi:hypothetical protein
MRTLILALTALTLGDAAIAAETTGSIAGMADGGAQIVVTNVANGEVLGIMAKCDGTYRAEPLKPGRWREPRGAHRRRRCR